METRVGGAILLRPKRAKASRIHNDKIFRSRSSFFPAQNIAERPVLHFERAKIRRTGKCSAEREALRNTLFGFDNLDPKTQKESMFCGKNLEIISVHSRTLFA